MCNLLGLLLAIIPYMMFAYVRFVISDWLTESGQSQANAFIEAKFISLSVGSVLLSGLGPILITLLS